ncbi:DNA-binding LytR/AlgR family response regulator [Sedimentibacter acidaminivorans]|uniref:DNA-binding LytR/AlgR family response regulator n=1 Tax=Sedimentibacter acidaminivorans TaxID=913099 RepID=A0ABS4GGU9_9FIRM|nr:LytTR family DNA-binding domain-containing protein [Sedimentibacter acidaminivorans]MBP1926920.1 DNA-binding LytR/AlgR family response regulator [Sedimentibacter acidaminivorans]
MLRCIIVDDEQALISELEFSIESIDEIEVIATYTDGIQALVNIVDMNIDIAFLDIEMPEITGVELAKRIKKIDSNISIIFITAYKQYAIDAFDIGAAHYLLKPIRKEKLITAIDRIKGSRDNQIKVIKGKTQLPEKISVKGRDSTTFIKIKDILYIESLDSKTILVTKKEKVTSKEKLQFWQNELLEVGFLRCHRSYIVNMEYIYRIKRILGSTYELLLDYEDIKVPVGRSNIQEVKQYLDME